MVYVNKDGQVGEKPLTEKASEYFWKMIYFFIFFFRALLAPLLGESTQYDPDSQARFRSTLRGGGGGGGGNGGPTRPGGGPRRPIGRLNTSGPSSMPSCPSGGCCR
ncbi:hypothetical protein Ddc_01526 [Ditylenchus destructor]|nr:hypothetical protein Ddc_01526 [Ditylenchus destructor]